MQVNKIQYKPNQYMPRSFSLAVLFLTRREPPFWGFRSYYFRTIGLTCFLFFVLSIYTFYFSSKSSSAKAPFGGVENVFACPMAIRNLLDALFPLYGLPYAQAAAELEMAAAAATVLARFFRRAERECAVKLPRAKSAPPLP